MHPLPSTLLLAISDDSNDLLSNLTDMTGNIVSSPIYYSPEDGQPYYSFSLLRFVRNRMLTISDTELALIVLPPDDENSTSFKRLVVDDNSTYAENVQLMVYYITY